jgi:hypothetical protein
MVDQGTRHPNRIQDQGQSREGSESTQREPMDQLGQMSNDLVNYLTEYARENPGYAALWCLGVGFVLGWKLKPW